jgi:dihydropteroate synthase
MILSSSALSLPKRQVMAIVNLTPDSFYAGSRHVAYDEVCRSVERAIDEGATVIDIGGY